MSGEGATLLDALRAVVGLEAHGGPVGNLTLGRGSLDGTPVRVALVENRVASGSIGKAEAARLSSLFAVVRLERTPLILYLDSAGARVSEGLEALGAFRRLFAEGLASCVAGVPVVAILGRNCFGGASMLAYLGARRLFSPATRLSMSGPAILAQAAGGDALDPVFVAAADATIGAASRVQASGDNAEWSQGSALADWLRAALAPAADPWAEFRARHDRLKTRRAAPPAPRAPEAFRRRDLDRLFSDGYEATEAEGVVTGAVAGDSGRRILGLLGNAHVGSARAWAFAEAAWQVADAGLARLDVLLDCETHAARLDDEKAVLSEYIVDMSVALARIRERGAPVELTILGRAGGGVYVALAAGASRVVAAVGSDIQVLPGAAVASILGVRQDGGGDTEAYRRAGVADDEIKLGLPPTSRP